MERYIAHEPEEVECIIALCVSYPLPMIRHCLTFHTAVSGRYRFPMLLCTTFSTFSRRFTRPSPDFFVEHGATARPATSGLNNKHTSRWTLRTFHYYTDLFKPMLKQSFIVAAFLVAQVIGHARVISPTPRAVGHYHSSHESS